MFGVDVHKVGVKAFKRVAERSLFPYAFTPVYRSYKSRTYGDVPHADGTGSKPVQNLLHYKETGDSKVLSWTTFDLGDMNIADIFADGVARVEAFLDIVDINHLVLPKSEYLAALAKGFEDVRSLYRKFGIRIPFRGGETAESPDQVMSVTVTGAVFGKIKLSDVITGEEIQPEDLLVAIASDGQATWETRRNSGIMTNGLFLARHCLMMPDYETKYPWIRDPNGKPYTGRFRTDQYHPDLSMSVGEALISPTRQFAIIIKRLLERYKGKIHGVSHNTGGGQTKVLRIGKDIHYVKDLTERDFPPLFYLVQEESKEDWSYMFEDFNMGNGLDVVVTPDVAEDITIDVKKEFGVDAWIFGRCESSTGKEGKKTEHGNMLTIKSRFGEFVYP